MLSPCTSIKMQACPKYRQRTPGPEYSKYGGGASEVKSFLSNSSSSPPSASKRSRIQDQVCGCLFNLNRISNLSSAKHHLRSRREESARRGVHSTKGRSSPVMNESVRCCADLS